MTQPEQPEEVAREAARGRSARTPLLAQLGVATVLAVVVAIVLGIAALAYFLAG